MVTSEWTAPMHMCVDVHLTGLTQAKYFASEADRACPSTTKRIVCTPHLPLFVSGQGSARYTKQLSGARMVDTQRHVRSYLHACIGSDPPDLLDVSDVLRKIGDSHKRSFDLKKKGA